MKITKDYLRTVIKEELERLDEASALDQYAKDGWVKYGNTYFNSKFEKECLNQEQLSGISRILAKLKPGKKIKVVMTPDGSIYSHVDGEDPKGIIKGGPDKGQIIVKYYEALMRAETAANNAAPVNFQRPQQPQQKPAQTTPAKLAPGSVMKSV